MSKPIEQELDINEDVADLAEAIIRIADMGDRLLKGGLTRKAIVILIQHKIGTQYINQRDIEAVLDALPRLKDYVDQIT